MWIFSAAVVLWVAELFVPATSHAAGFAPRRGTASSANKGTKKQVVTSITFTSKVRGTVFEDGLFVGVTNQVVSLSPGKHRLSITAVGYPDIKRTVILRPGQQLKVPIVFKKPTPKPRPKPRPAVVARPPSPQKAKPKTFSKPRTSGKMSYDSDLPMGKETIQSQARRQTAPAVRAPSPALPRYAPQAPQQPPAYQLSPPTPQAQPYYPPQQPVYAPPPQPYYQQPVYAPPPQPYYPPQPYMAPQPYYPPQQMAPQPMYGPPAPNYSSPMDTYSPVPLGSASRSAPSSAPKPRVKKRSAFLALLPFGIGQFQNEQALKGALFATGQAGCLIGAVVIMYQTRPYQEKISSGDDQYDQEQLKAFVTKQKQTQTYLYIGAGALWAIGVIDAFMNLDSYPKQTASTEHSDAPKTYLYSYGLGVHDDVFTPALKFKLKF